MIILTCFYLASSLPSLTVPDEPYSCSYVLRMVLSKNWQKYHQFGKNWNNFGDFSDNSAVLHITTKLVTEQCKLNMQYCMIHHINQNCSADAKMYHTWLYVKCTMIYDHKCTQFWRSVSASGHGNMILNKLPRPTRVRSRHSQCISMICTQMINLNGFDHPNSRRMLATII